MRKREFMHFKGQEAIELFVHNVQEYLTTEYGTIIKIFFILAFLMIIDVISGIYKARIKKMIASYKISDGLIKKGFEMIILLSLFFIQIVLPEYIGLPILTLFFILALFNELMSILENLYEAGVDLTYLKPLIKLLDVYNKILGEVKADEPTDNTKDKDTPSDGEVH